MPRVLRGKPDRNPKLRIREFDDTGNFGGKTSRRVTKYAGFADREDEEQRIATLTARRLRREARDRPPRAPTPLEPEEAPAPAPVEYSFSAPIKELSEAQKRAYGYGTPKWSPYYRPKIPGLSAAKTPKACSTEIGDFPATQSLSPALQMLQARNNIAEMKGRAVVDHLWEPMGHRPKGIDDLRWIDVSREQAEIELAYNEKMQKEQALAKAEQLAAEAAEE